MNKTRRKDLQRAHDLLAEAQAIVEQARDEEQEFYDNMPENMQGGEKGDRATGVIEALEEAVTQIEEAVTQIEEAVQ